MFGKSSCIIIMYVYSVITHTTHRLAVAVVSYRKVSIYNTYVRTIDKGRGVYNEGARDSTVQPVTPARCYYTLCRHTGKRWVFGGRVKMRPRPLRKPRLPVVSSSSVERHPWDPIAGPTGDGRNVRLQLHVGEETFIVVITDFFPPNAVQVNTSQKTVAATATVTLSFRATAVQVSRVLYNLLFYHAYGRNDS